MEMTDKEIYRNWKESKNPAAQVTIPADDMVQWLEALRACTDMVEGGAKITHICAHNGEQAEVGFTANGKNYLIRLEVWE